MTCTIIDLADARARANTSRLVILNWTGEEACVPDDLWVLSGTLLARVMTAQKCGENAAACAITHAVEEDFPVGPLYPLASENATLGAYRTQGVDLDGSGTARFVWAEEDSDRFPTSIAQTMELVREAARLVHQQDPGKRWRR